MIIVEETDKRFEIKESTLPNAGNGLFATELIKQGDCLEVVGVLVRNNGIADKCTAYANAYKFAATDKNPTCSIVPLGYGAMVNHTNDRKQQNVTLAYSKNRSKKNSDSGQVVYEALRDIQPGEELLGYYGAKLDEKLEWGRFLKFQLYDLHTLEL